jgi:hypothetical protein
MGRRRPTLTVEQILAWADEHHARVGTWPGQHSGPVTAAPLESWHAIDIAMRQGLRGLPGSDSVARLLTRERGVRNLRRPPPLAVGQILVWADAHHRRSTRWPGVLSGAIPEAPGENWRAVNLALVMGYRGLPGGDSLARLLVRHGRRRPRRGRKVRDR